MHLSHLISRLLTFILLLNVINCDSNSVNHVIVKRRARVNVQAPDWWTEWWTKYIKDATDPTVRPLLPSGNSLDYDVQRPETDEEFEAADRQVPTRKPELPRSPRPIPQIPTRRPALPLPPRTQPDPRPRPLPRPVPLVPSSPPAQIPIRPSQETEFRPRPTPPQRPSQEFLPRPQPTLRPAPDQGFRPTLKPFSPSSGQTSRPQQPAGSGERFRPLPNQPTLRPRPDQDFRPQPQIDSGVKGGRRPGPPQPLFPVSSPRPVPNPIPAFNPPTSRPQQPRPSPSIDVRPEEPNEQPSSPVTPIRPIPSRPTPSRPTFRPQPNFDTKRPQIPVSQPPREGRLPFPRPQPNFPSRPSQQFPQNESDSDDEEPELRPIPSPRPSPSPRPLPPNSRPQSPFSPRPVPSPRPQSPRPKPLATPSPPVKGFSPSSRPAFDRPSFRPTQRPIQIPSTTQAPFSVQTFRPQQPTFAPRPQVTFSPRPTFAPQQPQERPTQLPLQPRPQFQETRSPTLDFRPTSRPITERPPVKGGNRTPSSFRPTVTFVPRPTTPQTPVRDFSTIRPRPIPTRPVIITEAPDIEEPEEEREEERPTSPPAPTFGPRPAPRPVPTRRPEIPRERPTLPPLGPNREPKDDEEDEIPLITTSKPPVKGRPQIPGTRQPFRPRPTVTTASPFDVTTRRVITTLAPRPTQSSRFPIQPRPQPTLAPTRGPRFEEDEDEDQVTTQQPKIPQRPFQPSRPLRPAPIPSRPVFQPTQSPFRPTSTRPTFRPTSNQPAFRPVQVPERPGRPEKPEEEPEEPEENEEPRITQPPNFGDRIPSRPRPISPQPGIKSPPIRGPRPIPSIDVTFRPRPTPSVTTRIPSTQSVADNDENDEETERPIRTQQPQTPRPSVPGVKTPTRPITNQQPPRTIPPVTFRPRPSGSPVTSVPTTTTTTSRPFDEDYEDTQAPVEATPRPRPIFTSRQPVQPQLSTLAPRPTRPSFSPRPTQQVSTQRPQPIQPELTIDYEDEGPDDKISVPDFQPTRRPSTPRGPESSINPDEQEENRPQLPDQSRPKLPSSSRPQQPRDEPSVRPRPSLPALPGSRPGVTRKPSGVKNPGGKLPTDLAVYDPPLGPPQRLDRPDRPKSDGSMPECTLLGQNYCILTKDYPMDGIKEVVNKSYNRIKLMYEELQTVGDPDLFKSHVGDSKAAKGQFACETESNMMKPGWAKDEITKEWMIIVNTDIFPQQVRTESCKRPNEPCSFVAPYYESTCQQRYSLHRLIAVDPHDPGKSPVVALFKFPAGCSCRVHPVRISQVDQKAS